MSEITHCTKPSNGTQHLVIEPCDLMAESLERGFLNRQTLVNRKAVTSRQRIVLNTKEGHLPFEFCPFCGADIVHPAADAKAEAQVHYTKAPK